MARARQMIDALEQAIQLTHDAFDAAGVETLDPQTAGRRLRLDERATLLLTRYRDAHVALNKAGAPVSVVNLRKVAPGVVEGAGRPLSLVERIDALGERLNRHVAPVPRGGARETHESTLDEML